MGHSRLTPLPRGSQALESGTAKGVWGGSGARSGRSGSSRARTSRRWRSFFLRSKKSELWCPLPPAGSPAPSSGPAAPPRSGGPISRPSSPRANLPPALFPEVHLRVHVSPDPCQSRPRKPRVLPRPSLTLSSTPLQTFLQPSPSRSESETFGRVYPAHPRGTGERRRVGVRSYTLRPVALLPLRRCNTVPLP